MGKWIWKYILLLLALTKVSELNAADIRSAQDLKNALGNEASIEGNVVTLNNNKTITQTLNILGGTMTLVIPEGITLTGDFSSYSGDAITVNVNGGNLSVDGGGTVTSIAAKGADNTVGSGGKGQQGHSARTIIYENGILSLKKITILGIPGEGGDGGSGWFGASTGPKGDPGETWVLDPEDQKRVKDAIAPGYYIKGASNENYESAGYQTAEVIVDKITYQVSYDFNGGQKETDGTNTYTVDTKDFILPTAVKKGYSLAWLYNESTVNVNNLPIPVDTWGEIVRVDFVAEWTRIVYKITYDTKGGTLKDAVESYTVDTAFTLPTPTRDNYEFVGWYDEKGEKKERIVQGSTGDLTLTARWIPLYTVNYDYDQTIFEVTTLKQEFSENKNLPYTLPSLTSKEEDQEFAGWYYNETEQVKELTLAWFQNKVGMDIGGSVTLKAKASQVYFATLHWNSDEMSSSTGTVRFTSALEVDLPMSGNKRGYKFLGWCYKEDCSDTPISTIPAGIEKDIDLYAKWEPIQYALSYEYLYNGSVPSDAPKSYTIEQTVTLPIPTRSGYTFVGWHATDQTEGDWQTVVPFAFNENKDQTGDRTFYAEWKGGRQVIIKQPEGGTITVKNLTSGTAVESGGVVDEGTSLEISAQPSSSAYTLDKLLVNGERFTSSPCKVTMPDSCGLTISAVFIDGRPTASKPEIETTPANTDYVPVGESVWVTLRNTDSDAKLYYSIAGSEPEPYTKPFQVTSSSATDIVIQGIARKSGFKDAVASQTIKFGSDKITISFDLPAGVTALAPDGGDVISAIVSGGMFEFKLFFDRTIIDSTENIRVWANNETRVYGDASGVYRLWDQKSDVKITVSGITRKQYNVTLKQTAGGQIVFADDETTATRTVEGGDTVSVKASPNPGYYFIRWSDGETDSIRDVIVYSNLTLSAQFSQTKKVYKVVFPKMDGVTVKPLSAYSNEVDDGGTCKFYLRLDEDYDQSQPVVYANGEKLEPIGEVYSLYYIHQHYSISVRGIQKNPEEEFPFELPDNVACINMETGKSVTDSAVYADVMVTITAKAPNGKSFDKWNDNNKENPRIVKLSNASQYIPLWKESENTGCKVQFEFPAGCGIAAMDEGNAESVSSGSSFKFRLTVLPVYSQSKHIKVKVGETVIQPVTELRSSSESPTYYYVLDKVTGDTKVTVSGLEKNKYKLSIEQTAGGQVSISEADSVMISFCRNKGRNIKS